MVGHSLKQLTTTDYLSEDQMKHIDVKLVKQLNDVAQEVSKKMQECSRTNVLFWNSVRKKNSTSVVWHEIAKFRDRS